MNTATQITENTNQIPQKQYCEITKEYFETAYPNHAYVSDVMNLTYAHPLRYHYKRYLSGDGPKLGRVVNLHSEASKLPVDARKVLESLLAIRRSTGKIGTVLTHEFAASVCADITSSKCGERTYQNGIGKLKDIWITVDYTLTGTKDAIDASGNEWRMRKVCVVTLTPAALDLLTPPPKKPVLKNISCESLPRKKVPSAVSYSKHEQENLAQCFSEQRQFDESSRPRQETIQTNEVKMTSAARTSQHVEQRRIREVRSAHKAAKNSGQSLGRKSRNKARKSWAGNRASFLSDLFRYGKNSEVHRIAALQTDLAYPPLLPTAMHYEPVIFSWHEKTERERKREMERVILPQLRSFCAVLVCPPAPLPSASDECRRRHNEKMAAYNRVRAAFTGFSKSMITEDMPQHVLEQILKNQWMIDQTPWMLTTGKFRLQDCTEKEFSVFRDLADSFGQD